jgi:Kef-type K+ transport system membrane component KefB
MKVRLPLLCLLTLLLAAAPITLAGSGADGGHQDLFAMILLEIVIVILVAVFGSWVAKRFDQPAVLGMLLAGVTLGNVGYWLGLPLCTLVMHLSGAGHLFQYVLTQDVSVSEAAAHLESLGAASDTLIDLMTGPDAPRLVLLAIGLSLLSNLGVILLLFMVGLESSVDEMKQVGRPAILVALAGVALPFALGYGAGVLLTPEEPAAHHLFLAATLCATSVGITAAVFRDLGKLQTPEGKVILGAAVIDDILGLIILAVVIGIIASGGVDLLEIARIAGLALGFLGLLLVFGDRIVRITAGLYRFFDHAHLKLFYPLVLAFTLSWLASIVGLATIVGAFAAGLIVSERHLGNGDSKTAEEVLAPIENLFAPVFFVLMGMQVNLSTFTDPGTVLIGLALVVVAVVGKVLAGWAAGRGLDRLTVGIGMVPRGEVGLIFASIGKGLGVVNDAMFSALVLMVIATTLIAPIGLKWSLGRHDDPL